MKRSSIRRKPRRDPVTPEMYDAVLYRDFGCVAPRLGSGIETADAVNVTGGDPCFGRLTLDHVRDQPMMGKRAPSDPAHLVTLCWHHHLDGWATAHRPELRAYLEAINA